MERLISRYPLTGVREATTAPQHRFIAHATDVLAADQQILAVYLVGGFAVGLGDPWSDVDLQAVVSDAAFGAHRNRMADRLRTRDGRVLRAEPRRHRQGLTGGVSSATAISGPRLAP